MPTVLLPPKIDKLLPPSDSGMKAPSKRPKTSFNDALDKASPKPKPVDDAPPVKKSGHGGGGGGGGKKGAAKATTQPTAAVKGKVADTEETEQTEEESEHPQAKDQQPQPQVNVTDLPVPAKAKTADNAPKTPAQKADKSKADADAQVVVEEIDPQGKQQQQPKNPAKDDDEATEDKPAKTKSVAGVQTAGPKVIAKSAQAKTTQTPPVKETDDHASDASAADDITDSADQSSDEDATAQVGTQTSKVEKKAATSQPSQPSQTDTSDAQALGAGLKTPQTPAAASNQAAATDDSSAVQTVAVSDDSSDASPAPDPSAVPMQHLDPAENFAVALPTKAPAASAAARPAPPPPPAPPAPPEVRFADANHAQIVAGVRGQLLPDGGTMHIRLDPPELGALQVSVHMQDGVMSASFQTSNDDATKLLSHSLAQLKHALETQGVSVDKLHVTQAPRDEKGSNEESGKQQQSTGGDSSNRQEQQRREMLQRMWDRLANGSDPLDLDMVA